MKKFLTVLLALSVVFTYTFGTAFAAVPEGKDVITEAKVFENIDKAYKQALADAKTEKDAALATTFKSGATKVKAQPNNGQTILVTKTAVEKVYNELLFDAAVKKIEDKRNDVLKAVKTAMLNVATVSPAKAYNGNFTEANNQDEGYAIYNPTWDDVETYFKSTDDTSKYAQDKYEAIFKVANATTMLAEGTNDSLIAVSKAVFAETKATTLAAVQAIDLSVYSKEYKGGTTSNYDLALKDVTEAIKWINGLKAGDSWMANADYLIGKLTAHPGLVSDDETTYLYKAGVNQGEPTGVLFKGGTLDSVKYEGLRNIPKNADLPTEAAKLAWAQNHVLADLLTDTDSVGSSLTAVKTYYNNLIVTESLKGSKANATDIAKYQAAIAQAEELAAGAIETITYLVKNADDYTKLLTVVTNFTASDTNTNNWAYVSSTNDNTFTNDTFTANGKTGYMTYSELVNPKAVNHIMANIKDLKAQAELAKKTIGIDGTTMVEIENALAAGMKLVYNQTAVATLNVGDAVKALYNRQNALIGTTTPTTVIVADRTYNSVCDWANDTYYDTQYKDAVRKIVADAKTKIKEATTVALAEAAFLEGYKAMEAVPTTATKTTFQATKAYIDLKAQYVAEINAYVDYKVGVITSSDYAWNPTQAKVELVKSFDDAYTLDELKAAYTDARATVDNLKTKAQLKAAYDALMVKINALPVVPTLADKAVVVAVEKEVADHNDYCTLIANNTNDIKVLTAKRALESIKALELKGLVAQANAITKDYKVTVDEAKAVEALRAAYDAIVASYTTVNMATADITAIETFFATGVDIDGLEAKLAAAQVTAVEEMIAMLPADGSNVKGIKAARAAYDALDRDSKMSVYQSKQYDKLVDLEKLIKKDIKGGVLGTTLTATSKATKGAIKISWKKSAGYKVDGYQVYKSTKKFSGFKKAFTTKATSYKNTKGLKAGKTYYYKVRGFRTVDGVKVYTHWSTKVSRVAK